MEKWISSYIIPLQPPVSLLRFYTIKVRLALLLSIELIIRLERLLPLPLLEILMAMADPKFL